MSTGRLAAGIQPRAGPRSSVARPFSEVIVVAESDLLAAVLQRMNLKYAEWEDAVTVTPEGLA